MYDEFGRPIKKHNGRYLRNHNLIHIGKMKNNAVIYPLVFYDSPITFMKYDIDDGDVFQIQTINNIEYILMVNQNGGVISAYDTKGGVKMRVGAAKYHFVSEDKGLYLDRIDVREEYRLNHIGTYILKSLIYAEYKYLKKHNIFVHASAEVSSRNALNQEELENFYITNGLCLVNSKYEIFTRDDFISAGDNKYLQAIVREASKRIRH